MLSMLLPSIFFGDVTVSILQKDVLRKLGNPVPQNTLYMTVKVLLERTAPVLIDGFAVTALLKLVDNAVSSKTSAVDPSDAAVDVPNRVESGMKLLLVRRWFM